MATIVIWFDKYSKNGGGGVTVNQLKNIQIWYGLKLKINSITVHPNS